MVEAHSGTRGAFAISKRGLGVRVSGFRVLGFSGFRVFGF